MSRISFRCGELSGPEAYVTRARDEYTHHEPPSRWSWLLPTALVAGGAVGLGVLGRTLLRHRRKMDLNGKVVIVTGASRGLGLAIARELIDRNAAVAICARDEAELHAAQEDLHHRRIDAGNDVPAFAGRCDVTDESAVQAFVDDVRNAFGRVDAVINNAGIIDVGPLEQMSKADVEHSLAVNLYGPMHFVTAVMADFIARGEGRIVNIASVAGLLPAPHMMPYVVAKSALVGFSESLRLELLRHGVYVTTVCPGLISTGGAEHANFRGQAEQEHKWFATMDASKLLAISPASMARKVVSAMVHGEASLVTPINANLAARWHGMARGLSTELTSLAARAMPSAGGADEPRRGEEFSADLPAG